MNVSKVLRSFPEPARASAHHRFTPAYHMLEPGKFMSPLWEWFKPASYFQMFTESRTIAIFNVIVADREPGTSWGNLTACQSFPARVIQNFNYRRVIQMLHEIDLRELHHRQSRDR